MFTVQRHRSVTYKYGELGSVSQAIKLFQITTF